MKKGTFAFLCLVCVICACGSWADGAEKIIEIRERMFIQQCNDIYLNPEDYEGRTIKLEGIYDEYTVEDEVLRFVFR
jgi:uncharacterized membrane protein YcgQ (UPF0703/DUF1980 family)